MKRTRDLHHPIVLWSPIRLGLASSILLVGGWLVAAGTSATPATSATSQARSESSDETGIPRGLTDAELADGWLALFDGKTLFGWRAESDANWEVRDQQIIATEGSQPGLLRTTTQFDDYRLRVDFLATESTNSGVFLRTSPRPTDPAQDCLEVNIAPRSLSPFPTGSLVSRVANEDEIPLTGWHRLEMQVQGRKIQTWVDGHPGVELEIDRPLGRGFVGLQFNQGPIHFCNVFLKPLDLQPLFNGRDLTGWRTYPELATQASVTDAEELMLEGGRGQVETVSTHDDFVLQLAARTLVPGTNSGVFVRCIPTEEMNGYEVQIQNEVIDQDPARPKDCGTGGIFRRQDARFVHADDLAWAHLTIVAQGPHFSVWVNGLQVTDWHDPREFDANPRRGRRDEAGTIMLQGHDPESRILFRNLNVKSLSPRQR